MNKKAKNLHHEEKGNIIVLFAFMLVVIIIFMGFAVDIGLMYSKRNYLNEVGQAARESRFEEITYIIQQEDTYASDRALREVVKECMDANGIPDDQFETKFRDTAIENGHRAYKVEIHLWDTYEFKFLKIFGIKEQPIDVYISGGGYTRAEDWNPWK